MGLSRAMTSQSPISSCASCIRRRWPPQSEPTGADQSRSDAPGQPRPAPVGRRPHSCSGGLPTSADPTPAAGSRCRPARDCHLHAAAPGRPAGIRLDLPGQHAEPDWIYTFAVAADDPDAVPVDGRPSPVEHHLRGMAQNSASAPERKVLLPRRS